MLKTSRLCIQPFAIAIAAAWVLAVSHAGAQPGSPDASRLRQLATQAPDSGAPIGVSTTAADALAGQAVDLITQGKLEEATAKISAALQLRMDRSYYHLINGLSYHLQARQGKRAAYDLADQGYRLAIQFDRSNWLAHYYAGLLAIDQSRFAQANLHLAEALMFSPQDADVLHALSYSSYRTGRADMAAAAALQAAKAGERGATGLRARNAAMGLAAVGEFKQAREWMDRADGGTDRLRERLSDWEGLYRQVSMIKTQDAAASAPAAAPVMPQGQGSGVAVWSSGLPAMPPGWPFAPPAEEETTAPGTEHKMVVVDVVMIATEENFTTAKGVNLLNGLQLQFGQAVNAGYQRLFSSAGDSATITRALGIPAIAYTLNILNTSNQRNEILARPTLVARAGKPSQFFSGVELNAVAVSNSAVGGNPVSIQREVGVNLKITPLFLADNRINLDIVAERTFLKTPSNDVNFTFRLETTKSKVEANVVLRYGETLILGGLSEKEAENSRDGVPLLQDLPLVQYAFGRNTTKDFQKSVLILVTPRPPQYVYQTDKARQEYEKSLSEDERPLANLRARYADWFRPYPNWASVFHHMQENSLYREFRTGDVALENWADMRSLRDRLKKVLDFLHY